jgi:hypothetical protein
VVLLRGYRSTQCSGLWDIVPYHSPFRRLVPPGSHMSHVVSTPLLLFLLLASSTSRQPQWRRPAPVCSPSRANFEIRSTAICYTMPSPLKRSVPSPHAPFQKRVHVYLTGVPQSNLLQICSRIRSETRSNSSAVLRIDCASWTSLESLPFSGVYSATALSIAAHRLRHVSIFINAANRHWRFGSLPLTRACWFLTENMMKASIYKMPCLQQIKIGIRYETVDSFRTLTTG